MRPPSARSPPPAVRHQMLGCSPGLNLRNRRVAALRTHMLRPAYMHMQRPHVAANDHSCQACKMAFPGFRQALHTASPSAPLKEHLPEAISNPAARSRHPPPAAVSSCKPLSNTPLTGAFATPPVLELGGQTTPPGRSHARHTSSMAHSSIPAHFPRARASLQPMLCPSSTIIGAMCCTAHGSC